MISTNISLAKELLKNDSIIAIPTETVYGLAGNAFSELAVQKIFALKGRPLFNPLIVHLPSAAYLDTIACDIPEKAYALAKKFWPGPLTLVLKKLPHIPSIVSGGKETVAVRVPDHPLTLKLLESLEFPLAAPSANPFGSISPTSSAHVAMYFGDKLELILDGGECLRGIESTIIGFDGSQPILYRHGSIALDDIEKIVGKIIQATSNESKPDAPGMLSRHYAPSTECYLTDKAEKLIPSFKGKKIGLLVFTKKQLVYSNCTQEVLSPEGDLAEAAKNLYAALHRLDNSMLDVIIMEKVPNEGLGKSINDRLQRAVAK